MHFKPWFANIFIILSLLMLPACSTTNEQGDSYADPRDPLESINRPLWTFNWDYADKYVFKPVSTAYVDWVPSRIRSGVYNAALNLNDRGILKEGNIADIIAFRLDKSPNTLATLQFAYQSKIDSNFRCI